MPSKSSRDVSLDDAGKILAVVTALIGVGVLPKGWQKGVSAATAVVLILKLL
jgi:hypothetical protein